MIFPLVTFMFRIFDKHSISSGEHKLALLKPTKWMELAGSTIIIAIQYNEYYRTVEERMIKVKLIWNWINALISSSCQ